MNQMKIGKFIAACRKENGYTQASLAEKLGITDRAVSKWENGKSMPDASIMLELCGLLKINVNELLTGERIMQDDYKAVAEKQLVDLKSQEEKAVKKATYAVVIIVLLIILVFSLVAGTDIGGDLGRFIYNITH